MARPLTVSLGLIVLGVVVNFAFTAVQLSQPCSEEVEVAAPLAGSSPRARPSDDFAGSSGPAVPVWTLSARAPAERMVALADAGLNSWGAAEPTLDVFAEDPWLGQLESIVAQETRERLMRGHPRLRVLFVDGGGTVVRSMREADWGPMRRAWAEEMRRSLGVIPHARIASIWAALQRWERAETAAAVDAAPLPEGSEQLAQFAGAPARLPVYARNQSGYDYFYICSDDGPGRKGVICLVKNLLGLILGWHADVQVPPASGDVPTALYEAYDVVIYVALHVGRPAGRYLEAMRAATHPAKLWMPSESYIMAPTDAFRIPTPPAVELATVNFCPVLLDWFLLPPATFRRDMWDSASGQPVLDTVPVLLAHAVDSYREMYGPLVPWATRHPAAFLARDGARPEVSHALRGAPLNLVDLDTVGAATDGNGKWFRHLSAAKYFVNGGTNRYSTGQMIQDAALMGALIFANRTRACARLGAPPFTRWAEPAELQLKLRMVEAQPELGLYLRSQMERRLRGLLDLPALASAFQVLERVWVRPLGRSHAACGHHLRSLFERPESPVRLFHTHAAAPRETVAADTHPAAADDPF